MGYNKSRPLLEQERSNVQGTTKQNAGAYVGVAFEDLAQIMKDRDDKLMSGDVYTDLPPEVDNTIPPVVHDDSDIRPTKDLEDIDTHTPIDDIITYPFASDCNDLSAMQLAKCCHGLEYGFYNDDGMEEFCSDYSQCCDRVPTDTDDDITLTTDTPPEPTPEEPDDLDDAFPPPPVTAEQIECTDMMGDLDGDGQITPWDVFTYVSVALGNISLEDSVIPCPTNIPCDFSGEGDVIDNMMVLYAYQKGFLDELPPCGGTDIITWGCGTPGDLNGDGEVNAQEAYILNDIASGIISPSEIPCPTNLCDFSGVGDMEANAQIVLDYVAGNITELPPCGGSVIDDDTENIIHWWTTPILEDVVFGCMEGANNSNPNEFWSAVGEPTPGQWVTILADDLVGTPGFDDESVCVQYQGSGDVSEMENNEEIINVICSSSEFSFEGPFNSSPCEEEVLSGLENLVKKGSYEKPLKKDPCCKKCKNGKFSDSCCDDEVGEQRCVYDTISDCQLRKRQNKGKCKGSSRKR